MKSFLKTLQKLLSIPFFSSFVIFPAFNYSPDDLFFLSYRERLQKSMAELEDSIENKGLSVSPDVASGEGTVAPQEKAQANQNPLPKSNPRVLNVRAYGYSSEVWQTDNTPRITANGSSVFWGGIANNCLPFNTKVKILHPKFSGMTFTVNDRMNKRYWCNVIDIWHPSTVQAKNWGVRELKIEIY